MIKVINNQKQSIGFGHIKGLNVKFEQGTNVLPQSSYNLLEKDTYFNWYIDNNKLQIVFIEDAIQHTVLEQYKTKLVDTQDDIIEESYNPIVVDWLYVDLLETKDELDDYATSLGFPLDKRKSYPNMVVSFKDKVESLNG